MPTTTNGITYPDGTGHTRLWEHLQTLAEDADDLASSRAPLASPAFTGNPTAPTPSPGDNDTSIATTAFVTAAVAGGGTLIRKATSEYLTSTTTVQDDNDFVFSLTSGTWKVEGLLLTSLYEGGIKTTWSCTATVGWSNRRSLYSRAGSAGLNSAWGGLYNDYNDVHNLESAATGINFGFIDETMYINVTTSGTLTFRWAQYSSDTDNTGILSNSVMQLTKLA